jgi:hypothetical protein
MNMRYGRYARSEVAAKTRREVTISSPRSSHLSSAEVGTIAVPWRYHGRMMGGHLIVVVVIISEAYYTELHFARKFC